MNMTHPYSRNTPSQTSTTGLLFDDPLSNWIQDRQKAFSDYQRSFFDTTPSTSSSILFPTIPRSSLFSSSSPSLQKPAMLSDTSDNFSPKAKVSYDDKKFQVELPLSDYRPEELSVKTEGDVLVILAKHETQTESGGSFVSKQFEQRFSLPSGVKPDSIVSSLSKQGNLTVTAPRVASQPASQAIKRSDAAAAVFNPVSTAKNEGLPHPNVKYDEDKFQISLDCSQFRPEELDVKVDGHTIIITAKQEAKEAAGTRTRVFEQKFTLPSGVQADRVTSTIGTDGVLNITAPRGSASASAINQTIEERMDRVLSPSSWLSKAASPPPTLLTKRNLEFDDDDDAASDSGLAKVVVEDDTYKIVLNVQQFKPEELVIKTVGQTVQVEAKHEEKTADGHAYSSRNFSQSFTLPRGVEPDSVSSSLSKAGQLTIAAPMPKPQHKTPQNERLVPIKHH